ncbi:MAG TPA: HD domain-containing protein [Streptosporangiaceae bacterium]
MTGSTGPDGLPDRLGRTELAALLDGLRDLPYGGEPVDQHAHAMQAAALAVHASADDELVLAAALHDIGRAGPVRRAYAGPHEAAGGAFARRYIGERVAWVIEQHVPAKRYLVATDAAYADRLSPASVRSLHVQGGPMTPAEADHFATHPWAGDAVDLRLWDDAAKLPGDPGLPVARLLDILARVTT